MSHEKWNESGRVWEEDHGLLDAKQVRKCARADLAEPLSPVPTRMISKANTCRYRKPTNKASGSAFDGTRRRGEPKARHQSTAIPGGLGRHRRRVAPMLTPDVQRIFRRHDAKSYWNTS
jgi:hypothetical protein